MISPELIGGLLLDIHEGIKIASNEASIPDWIFQLNQRLPGNKGRGLYYDFKNGFISEADADLNGGDVKPEPHAKGFITYGMPKAITLTQKADMVANAIIAITQHLALQEAHIDSHPKFDKQSAATSHRVRIIRGGN